MNNSPSVDSPPNELPAAKTERSKTKKVYNKPILYICGDFRDITLGASAATGESGQSGGPQVGSSFFGGTRHYER